MSLYSLIRPILFSLPAESAHQFALASLRVGLGSSVVRDAVSRRLQTEPFGRLKRFGLEFQNPIGLAAGFDKNGSYARELAALGFGFIEVGTATNEGQGGNPKPRIFRLLKDRALINRLGFNNVGAAQVAENLRRHRPDCILGVNIGKSRSVPIEDAIPDYLASFDAVYDVADYIAINVSSPNTPDLRALQQHQLLEELLAALQQRNDELSKRHSLQEAKPLLLKIAPDLSESEIESIVDVSLRTNVAGIIATNTTIKRDGLQTLMNEVRACGEGGLSGAPLRDLSNQVISFIYRTARGKLPIIGVGGVFTAEDAWEKICAGASLIQLYTGFIYEGPSVAKRINEGLADTMKREGFESLDDAVGCRVS
ncbi:MAG TPA: quinone-dependent dihydroorotate dehydrogenase [Pyrinomonadaceae bacterium]|nr:quinone-dependent dihydroorotate dehydrogenase [Pyrinomonadaceae bacterium]